MTACLPASVSPRRACPSPRSRRLEMRPASFLDLPSHLAGVASIGTKVESFRCTDCAVPVRRWRRGAALPLPRPLARLTDPRGAANDAGRRRVFRITRAGGRKLPIPAFCLPGTSPRRL